GIQSRARDGARRWRPSRGAWPPGRIAEFRKRGLRLMAARKLDGLAVAQAIRAEVGPDVDAFVHQTGRRPGLALVLVGHDPASELYVGNKLKSAAESGIRADVERLSAMASLDELLHLIDSLNQSDVHDGILVQSPLPPAMGRD